MVRTSRDPRPGSGSRGLLLNYNLARFAGYCNIFATFSCACNHKLYIKFTTNRVRPQL